MTGANGENMGKKLPKGTHVLEHTIAALLHHHAQYGNR